MSIIEGDFMKFKYSLLILTLTFGVSASGFLYTPQWLSNRCPQPITINDLLVQHHQGYKKNVKDIKNNIEKIKDKIRDLSKETKRYCGLKINLEVDPSNIEDIDELFTLEDNDNEEIDLDEIADNCTLTGYHGGDDDIQKGISRKFSKGDFIKDNLKCERDGTDVGVSKSELIDLVHRYPDLGCKNKINQDNFKEGKCKENDNDTVNTSNEKVCNNGKMDKDNATEFLSGIVCKKTSLIPCKKQIKNALESRENQINYIETLEELFTNLEDALDDHEDEKEDAIESLQKKIRSGSLQAHCPSGLCYQKPKQSGWDIFERVLGAAIGVGTSVYLADRAIDHRSRLGFPTPSGAVAGAGISALWPFLFSGGNSSQHALLCSKMYGSGGLGGGTNGAWNLHGNFGYNSLLSLYGPQALPLLLRSGLSPFYANPGLGGGGGGGLLNLILGGGLGGGGLGGGGGGLLNLILGGGLGGGGLGGGGGGLLNLILGGGLGGGGLGGGGLGGGNGLLNLILGGGLGGGGLGGGGLGGSNGLLNLILGGGLGGGGLGGGGLGGGNGLLNLILGGGLGGGGLGGSQFQAIQVAMEYQQRRIQNQQIAQQRLQGLYQQMGILQSQVQEVYRDYIYGDFSGGGDFYYGRYRGGRRYYGEERGRRGRSRSGGRSRGR